MILFPCDFLTVNPEGGLVCSQEKQLYTVATVLLPRRGCLPIGRSERNCCVQVPSTEFELGLAIKEIEKRDIARK